jgi:hypothetical protein
VSQTGQESRWKPSQLATEDEVRWDAGSTFCVVQLDILNYGISLALELTELDGAFSG